MRIMIENENIPAIIHLRFRKQKKNAIFTEKIFVKNSVIRKSS